MSALVLISAFAPLAAGQAFQYRIVDLDDGSGWNNPWGIAEGRGAAAGTHESRGFVWRDASGLELLHPLRGHTVSTAAALDADGNVCGSSGRAEVGVEPQRAVRFLPGGTVEDLGTLGGLYSFASEMNPLGHIVGDAGTNPSMVDWHAFLWRKRFGMIDLTPGAVASHASDVSDFDAVTGWFGADGSVAVERALRWTPVGGVVDLGVPAGFKSGRGLGINAAGQVCGTAKNASGTTEAWVRYTDGAGWQYLLTNAGQNNKAWKINDFGQVIGDTHGGGGSQRAAIWTDGIGIQDLNALVDPAANWILMAAHDINERGEIVGWGRVFPSGLIHGYRLEPNHFFAYGEGCPGGGGHVPVLGGFGVPAAGNTVQLLGAEGTPNGSGLLLISLTTGKVKTGGCFYLLGAPLTAIPVTFDGNRQMRLPVTLPATVPSGVSLYFQMASLDPLAPNGSFALSNRLKMLLP
jgi:uncharacterized membrane protein